MSDPLATHDYAPGALDAALEFLKRTRWELRSLRKVRVWADRLRILDVNGDAFEVRGVGYPDPDVVPLLRAVNTAFDPVTIHEPTTQEYKEFLTGRRHPWAADRVM
jgi:hypothetical protein